MLVYIMTIAHPHHKELHCRVFVSIGAALLGFDDDLHFFIRQSGLPIFLILLPLDLPVRTPLLLKYIYE